MRIKPLRKTEETSYLITSGKMKLFIVLAFCAAAAMVRNYKIKSQDKIKKGTEYICIQRHEELFCEVEKDAKITTNLSYSIFNHTFYDLF